MCQNGTPSLIFLCYVILQSEEFHYLYLLEILRCALDDKFEFSRTTFLCLKPVNYQKRGGYCTTVSLSPDKSTITAHGEGGASLLLHQFR